MTGIKERRAFLGRLREEEKIPPLRELMASLRTGGLRKEAAKAAGVSKPESAAEKRAPGPAPRPRRSEAEALLIRSEADWQELVKKAMRLEGLEKALRDYAELDRFYPAFNIYKKKLAKFCASSPKEYDEETTENIAPALCHLLNNFRQILEACNYRGTSPPYQVLQKEIDSYFAILGVEKAEFAVNTHGDAWNEMEGEITTIPVNTDDQKRAGYISHIMVQPRRLCYRNKDDELVNYHFCGKGAIYTNNKADRDY